MTELVSVFTLLSPGLWEIVRSLWRILWWTVPLQCTRLWSSQRMTWASFLTGLAALPTCSPSLSVSSRTSQGPNTVSSVRFPSQCLPAWMHIFSRSTVLLHSHITIIWASLLWELVYMLNHSRLTGSFVSVTYSARSRWGGSQEIKVSYTVIICIMGRLGFSSITFLNLYILLDYVLLFAGRGLNQR